MVSGLSNAKLGRSRPKSGYRKWWISTRVLTGLTIAYTFITVGVICRFISTNGYVSSPTTKIAIKSFGLNNFLLSNVTRKNIVMRKNILMRVVAEETSCPGNCTSICRSICSGMGLPEIRNNRRISTTTFRPTWSPTMELICVFAFARHNLWPKAYQCTRYVYLRNNASGEHTAPDMVTRKADNMYSRARHAFQKAAWYFGYDGRILEEHGRSEHDLEEFIRGVRNLKGQRPSSEYLNMASFHGIAFINVPVRNIRIIPRLLLVLKNLNSTSEPSMEYLFTFVVHPYLYHTFPLYKSISELMLGQNYHVGINTKKLPDPGLIGRNLIPDTTLRKLLPEALEIINNISTSTPSTQKLCISISQNTFYQNLDTEHTLNTAIFPYSRVNPSILEDESHSTYIGGFPSRFVFENETYLQGATPTRLVYDTKASIQEKMREVFKYYNAPCIVFDDIGEDSVPTNWTVLNISHVWRPYELLKTVVDEMKTFGGRPLPTTTISTISTISSTISNTISSTISSTITTTPTSPVSTITP